MDVGTAAQIVSAVSSVLYAVIFGILYYMLLRVYRKTFEEMREERMAKERPQVIVEADYGRLPEVDLVIRNMSRGAAKEISFEFSRKVEDSEGFIITDLPYFKHGIDFLGPEGEIRCYWDSLENIISLMRRTGIEDGVSVTVLYRDLSGEPFEDRWIFNPLVYEENRNIRRAELSDLVEAVEGISKKLDENERSRLE